MRAYTGRFAPSPTGPLHAGSLVAALASWLDARAHDGRWLVRIEDVDTTRCRPEHERTILAQLWALGLHADGGIVRQRDGCDRYQAALDQLRDAGRTFACACSRQDIERALIAQGRVLEPHAERVYPGTCRDGLGGRTPRTERLRVDDGVIAWHDRRLGPQRQDVSREVGDVVLGHADGRFTYQLAVVVDDAEQGVTHVVRGEDLADNTARQIVLQHALGVATPAYLHTPLVLAPDGQKLSKQTGARAIDTSRPARALRAAGAVLGLDIDPEGDPPDAPDRWLARAVDAWKRRWAATPLD